MEGHSQKDSRKSMPPESGERRTKCKSLFRRINVNSQKVKSDTNRSTKKKQSKMRFPSTVHEGKKGGTTSKNFWKNTFFIFFYHANWFLLFIFFLKAVLRYYSKRQCFCPSCKEPWFKLANLKLDKYNMPQ